MKALHGVQAIPAETDQTTALIKNALRQINTQQFFDAVPRQFMDQYSKIVMNHKRSIPILFTDLQTLSITAFSLAKTELKLSSDSLVEQIHSQLSEYPYSSDIDAQIKQLAKTVNQLKPYFAGIKQTDELEYKEQLQELVMNTLNLTVLHYPKKFAIERSVPQCMIQSM